MEIKDPLKMERIEILDDSPEVKSWDPKKRILWHKISSENVDRMGDIVRLDGIKTRNFKKKPGVLYGHNYSGLDPVPVIGGNVGFKKERPVLWAGTKFLNERDVSPKLADLVNDLIILNQLNLVGWSIGFKALKVEKILDKEGKWIGFDFVESDLLEYSNVIIPANQDAVNNAISKGMEREDLDLRNEDESRIRDRLSMLKDWEENQDEFIRSASRSIWVFKDPEDEYEREGEIEDLDNEENKGVTVEIVNVDARSLEAYESGDPIKNADPDPDSHTATLEETAIVDPDSFRRVEGDAALGRRIAETPVVIWGKYVDAAKPQDPAYPIEIRFPVNQWSIKAAKKWLDKNSIDVKSFETAENAKEYLAIFDIISKSVESITSGLSLLEKILEDLTKSQNGGK